MRIFNSSTSHSSKKKEEKEWLGASFKPENFIPGIVIGFILGLLLDLTKPSKSSTSNTLKKTSHLLSRNHPEKILASSKADEDLKMVLVVRQDLKMAQGKVASQCAHAATGMYADLMQSDRYLLRQWEQCGQPKIVVTCKNQQEMSHPAQGQFLLLDQVFIYVECSLLTSQFYGSQNKPLHILTTFVDG
ncbi:uncharacterized protein LOC132635820 isoform X3 [Lycium barbarum]|uniref:uncharacterized protein LOC132635820 isoform X3 n=1 Tax=Lycium barbarum TaxID=112863 RepID=UPI00293EFF61|nr:uncharacterized protein LOC132635820 isoform X3 [Lycium barbarum]